LQGIQGHSRSRLLQALDPPALVRTTAR